MSKPRFSIKTLLWSMLVVAAFLGGRASMQPVVGKLQALASSLSDQLAWHRSALEEVLRLQRADQQELAVLRMQVEAPKEESNNCR